MASAASGAPPSVRWHDKPRRWPYGRHRSPARTRRQCPSRRDHIVPWESAYKATQIYTGPIQFVLSGSGHVAGVVNHPDNNKYNYWINSTNESNPKKWLEKAKSHEGSWWNNWIIWLTKKSGNKIKATKIDAKVILEDSPGSYLEEKTSN